MDVPSQEPVANELGERERERDRMIIYNCTCTCNDLWLLIECTCTCILDNCVPTNFYETYKIKKRLRI